MRASVVVPVLNEGPRLARCVEALQAQDTRAPFEVLVVDGGSRDGCLEPLRGLPVRVVEAPGTTAAAARNVGARRARGELLLFTDGDCIPEPGWLEALRDAFRADPGLAGAGGALRHLRTGGAALGEDLDTRAWYRGFITSNAAYRRAPFEAVGGFDPALCCAEDWDLGWRVQEQGYRMAHCPAAVVVHDPSENRSLAAFARKQAWYARHDLPAFAKALARGRAGGPMRRGAARGALAAGLHAATLAMLASGLLAPAGALLLGSWALARAAGTAARLPEARRHLPRLVAHDVVKGLARGWGAWRGLADLARGPPRAPPPAVLPEPREWPSPAQALAWDEEPAPPAALSPAGAKL